MFNFRVWNKKEKKYENNNNIFISFQEELFIKIKKEDNRESFEIKKIDEKDFIIQKALGYNDIKGKEVYEGDVIKRYWEEDYPVTFSCEEYLFGEDLQDDMFKLDYIEIVGDCFHYE